MKKKLCVNGCDAYGVCRGLCVRCASASWRRKQGRAIRKRRPLCWAEGCPRKASADHGLCRRHLKIADDWNAGNDELMTICCFDACGEIIDPETYGWEYPPCPLHRWFVGQAIELQEWGITEDVSGYLDFSDWIFAKWIAAVLGGSVKNAHLIEKVRGETGIFRPVADTSLAVYLTIPSILAS